MNKQAMLQRLAEPSGEAVKSAWIKNLPFGLDELDKADMDSKDGEVSIPIVIKARLLLVNDHSVSSVVESVTITRNVKHIDDDFVSIDIDLDQPDLPGINQ